MNGEKNPGKKIKRKYNVHGYPTVIFVNNKGREIDRICGYDNKKEEFFAKIKQYTKNENTLPVLLDQHKNTPEDYTLNYKLAKKYVDIWESQDSKPYFEMLLELDPENRYGHKEEAHGYLAYIELSTNKNDEPLWSFLNNCSNIDMLKLGFRPLIRYYKKEKMQEKLMNAYELVFTKLPENTDYMNDYAWYIYENKMVEKFNHGIELAEKAVELKPEKTNIWDTLAWLEFEQGNVDRAIEIMKKCVKMDPEREYYKKNLEIFLKKNTKY